jgi:hypothetical protein
MADSALAIRRPAETGRNNYLPPSPPPVSLFSSGKTKKSHILQCSHNGLTLIYLIGGKRSSRVVTASDCQCQSRISPGSNPSNIRYSGAADEAVLANVNPGQIG